MGFGGGNLKGLTSGGLEGPNSILKHPSLGNLIGGGTNLLGSDNKKSAPAAAAALAGTDTTGTQSLTATGGSANKINSPTALGASQSVS